MPPEKRSRSRKTQPTNSQPRRKRSATPKEEPIITFPPYNFDTDHPVPTLQELYKFGSRAWMQADFLVDDIRRFPVTHVEGILSSIDRELRNIDHYLSVDDIPSELKSLATNLKNHLEAVDADYLAYETLNEAKELAKNYGVVDLTQVDAAISNKQEQLENLSSDSAEHENLSEELKKLFEINRLKTVAETHKASAESYWNAVKPWPGTPADINTFIENLPKNYKKYVDVQNVFEPDDNDYDAITEKIAALPEETTNQQDKKYYAERIWGKIWNYISNDTPEGEYRLPAEVEGFGVFALRDNSLLTKPSLEDGKFILTSYGNFRRYQLFDDPNDVNLMSEDIDAGLKLIRKLTSNPNTVSIKNIQTYLENAQIPESALWDADEREQKNKKTIPRRREPGDKSAWSDQDLKELLENQKEDALRRQEKADGIGYKMLVIDDEEPDTSDDYIESTKENIEISKLRPEEAQIKYLNVLDDIKEVEARIEQLQEEWDTWEKVSENDPRFPQRETQLKQISKRGREQTELLEAARKDRALLEDLFDVTGPEKISQNIIGQIKSLVNYVNTYNVTHPQEILDEFTAANYNLNNLIELATVPAPHLTSVGTNPSLEPGTSVDTETNTDAQMIIASAPQQLPPQQPPVLSEDAEQHMRAAKDILDVLRTYQVVNIPPPTELAGAVGQLLTRLTSERDNALNDQRELHYQLEQERRTAVGLRHSNAELTNELTAVNQLHQETIAAINEQHQGWEEESQGLRNQIDTLDQEILNLRAQIEEKNDQLAQRSNQLANLAEQAERPIVETKDQYIQNTRDDFHFEIPVMRISDERDKNRIAGLEHENAHYRDYISSLREQVTTRFKNDNLFKDDLIKKLQRETVTLRNAAVLMRSRLIAQLMTSNAAASDSNTWLRIYHERPTIPAANLNLQNQREFEELTKQRDQLHDRLLILTGEHADLIRQYENLENSHRNLQTENNKNLEAIAELHKPTHDTIKKLKEENKNLEKAWQASDSERVKTQKALDESLRAYALAANRVVGMLRDYPARNKDVLVDLNNMIEELVQANASLKTQSTLLTEAGQRLTAQHQEQLETLKQAHEQALYHQRAEYNRQTQILTENFNKNAIAAMNYYTQQDKRRDEDKQRELAAMDKKYAEQRNTAEEGQIRELEALRNKNEAKIASIEERHAEELRNLSLDYERQLAELTVKLEAQEAALNADFGIGEASYYQEEIAGSRDLLTHLNAILQVSAKELKPHVEKLVDIYMGDLKKRLDNRRRDKRDEVLHIRRQEDKILERQHEIDKLYHHSAIQTDARLMNHMHDGDMIDKRAKVRSEEKSASRQAAQDEAQRRANNAASMRTRLNQYTFDLIGKLIGSNNSVATTHGYSLLAEFTKSLLELPAEVLDSSDIQQYLNMYDNGSLDRLVNVLAQPRPSSTDDALSKRITDLERTVRSFINMTAQRTAHVGAAQAYHPPRRVFVGREGVPHQGNRYARGYRSNRKLPPRRPDGRFKRVSPVRKHKK